MKNSFVHITANGSFVKNSENNNITFPLQNMKKLIGDESGNSWIECVYHQFSNQNIVIICDEEFELKNYMHPTIITRCGIAIKGASVIAGLVQTDDDKDIGYLTEEECLEALHQLAFLPAL